MKVAVYDTYVIKKDGSVMHFDIIVPVENKDVKGIHNFGHNIYLIRSRKGSLLRQKNAGFVM